MTLLLAGDIGGTKTLLAVFEDGGDVREPVAQAEFASAEYSSLASMVQAFLAGRDLGVESACFAIAGPVINGAARLTNLPWAIDRAELCRDLGLERANLLNDVEAIARMVPALHASEVVELNAGERVPTGTIAVVAAGTGLGEAFLTWDGTRHTPHASEGGHVGFAPADARQARLLEHVREQFGHVSVERVCSGIGIPNIYEFLRDGEHIEESAALAARFSGTSDDTRIILDASSGRDADPLCAQTAECFAEILGAEASNLALKVMAFGGVYLAGSLPSIVLPAHRDAFLKAFRHKGRFSEALSRVPIHVVTTRHAALMGAALRGFELAATPATAALD